MDVIIRVMNEDDDLEQVTDWFQAIPAEWLRDYPAVPRERADIRERLQQWRRGEDGNSCILLAESADPPAPAGFAVCLLQTDPETQQRFGVIHGIFVVPDCRNRGIGRRLKDAADMWCRDAGASFMKAYVGVDNEAMLRVCKLLGYEPWMLTMIRKFD